MSKKIRRETKMPPEAAKDPIDKLDDELAAMETETATAEAVAPDPTIAPELLDEATLRLILSMPFDFIAARKGEHWKLSPEELAAVAPLAAKVANKYAPAILARWADEIALVSVFGIILIKRVNVDNAKSAEEKPAQAA